jgi:hypothetical protein
LSREISKAQNVRARETLQSPFLRDRNPRKINIIARLVTRW